MILVFLSYISKRKEVNAFLEELRELLEKDDFDIESGFFLVRKHKPEDNEHSTPYTLWDLDYEVSDVIDRLRELTVEDYSETKIDKDNMDPPQLFVFGKDIAGNLVYIKLKIRGKPKKRIICVSFHYAKSPMAFPYGR